MNSGNSTPDNQLSDYLKTEYEKKKSVNAKYSLRAFASHLRIDQSLLSKVLKGERNVSVKLMDQILSVLKAAPEVRDSILRSRETRRELNIIPDEMVEVIPDWKHFAVLEAFRLSPFDVNGPDLADRLGLHQDEARLVLADLETLGLVRQGHGKYHVTSPGLVLSAEMQSSPRKRKLYEGLLRKTLEKLGDAPSDDEFHSSMTMALSKSDLQRLVRLVKLFKAEVLKLTHKTEEKSDVYQISLSFVPLTKK